jgi:TetR/AcrR family transcriptional regulator, transcriptional repressor of bet genes
MPIQSKSNRKALRGSPKLRHDRRLVGDVMRQGAVIEFDREMRDEDEDVAPHPVSLERAARGLDRTASREVRRRQLIESTVAEIAENGLSGLKISGVAQRAKLATGMVNFHFISKAQLLDATLDYLSEEYRLCWRHAVDDAGPVPAARLRAMMMADLDPQVCTRRRIAVWHAFYGEARARPAFLARCAQREVEHHAELVGLCAAVIEAGGGAAKGMTAERAASGLSALTDGIWLGLLFSPGRIDREPGRQTIDSFLAAVFPHAFAGE